MSGTPWTKEQDDALRAAATLGLSDKQIFDLIKPLRPNMTLEGMRQHRRLVLRAYLPRGGPRPHPRPEGSQRRCLKCERPFRSKHKHNRLCPDCASAVEGMAA